MLVFRIGGGFLARAALLKNPIGKAVALIPWRPSAQRRADAERLVYAVFINAGDVRALAWRDDLGRVICYRRLSKEWARG